MKLLRTALFTGLLGCFVGCVETYEPEVAATDANLLVVDGFINTQGVSVFRLSRTMGLSAKGNVPAEARAKVYIEEANGPRYPLTEGAAGTYSSGPLQLAPGRQVRLRLTTVKGQEYASDYTTAYRTPPIDSVSWRIGGGWLRLYVNTHDDADQAARHFRWTQEATWKFHSRYRSYYRYRRGVLVYRTEDIFNCWGSEAPSTIQVAHTLNFTRNAISEQVAQLADVSPRLFEKYSLLVRQQAISPEEYDYWHLLRKNTENLGTVFDPLPSQLTGNVHSLSSPDEKVLGFVGAQSVTEKRIFIDRNDLPPDWPLVTGYETCALYGGADESIFADSTKWTPVDVTPGIIYGTADCIDCRRRGTNVKPSFWP